MVDDVKVILAEYRRALKSTISTRMNKSYKYTGLVIILIFFGLIFIPKIFNRLANDSTIQTTDQHLLDPYHI